MAIMKYAPVVKSLEAFAPYPIGEHLITDFKFQVVNCQEYKKYNNGDQSYWIDFMQTGCTEHGSVLIDKICNECAQCAEGVKQLKSKQNTMANITDEQMATIRAFTNMLCECTTEQYKIVRQILITQIGFSIPNINTKENLDQPIKIEVGGCDRSKKIQAIKAYRAITGATLKDAKDFVESLDAPRSISRFEIKISKPYLMQAFNNNPTMTNVYNYLKSNGFEYVAVE